MFQRSIQYLRLAIELRVVGQVVTELRIVQLEEGFIEVTNEDGVTVTYNCRGHATKVERLTKKNFSHLSRRIWMFDEYEMRILGEVIDYNQYCIASLCRGKAFDKIHNNVYPYFRWNWKWLNQTLWFNTSVTCSLACITASNKGLNFLP